MVLLKFQQDAKLDPAWLLRLVQSRGDLTLLPPAIDHAQPPRASNSWWTVRATDAEVTAGFSREAMTAEAPPDPAAKGGLFERLGQVLGQIAQA